jgi:hypothetical protein
VFWQLFRLDTLSARLKDRQSLKLVHQRCLLQMFEYLPTTRKQYKEKSWQQS